MSSGTTTGSPEATSSKVKELLHRAVARAQASPVDGMLREKAVQHGKKILRRLSLANTSNIPADARRVSISRSRKSVPPPQPKALADARLLSHITECRGVMHKLPIRDVINIGSGKDRVFQLDGGVLKYFTPRSGQCISDVFKSCWVFDASNAIHFSFFSVHSFVYDSVI